MFCVWLWIIIYTEYTQKNGAVSKVNKKCIFFTLHGHNVHRQQQQLSKFLMCYQQFASHAYCGAAVPFSKMASQQENSVFSVLRCPDVWLRCSVNFVHGLEKTQPHAQIQHQRDFPKVNISCALSCEKVHGPFFCTEATVTGHSFLDMSENWLLPQLNTNYDDYILQLDGALPHFHRNVRVFLNLFLCIIDRAS